LVINDTNDEQDIFLHDVQSGTTSRISIAWDGSQADYGSHEQVAINADGRYVAFWAWATNLVPNDTNEKSDVFVRDRISSTTIRVSVASNGSEGNHDSNVPFISSNGRYVAFSSTASNLVTGDTNGQWDAFVHDRGTQKTRRVSVASDGSQAHGSWGSAPCGLSADGRYVAFVSGARDLVIGDTNDVDDVFVHDRANGTTTRVSVASDGTESNDETLTCALSGDGRFVALHSYASNLVPNDTNEKPDVFLHDRYTGHTTRVSVDSNGGQADGWSGFPSLSSDGRFVTFDSSAEDLVPDDSNGREDIFVHDRVTGRTYLASESSAGNRGNGDSTFPAITSDGELVAYRSRASNLVEDDNNLSLDVFLSRPATIFADGFESASTSAWSDSVP